MLPFCCTKKLGEWYAAEGIEKGRTCGGSAFVIFSVKGAFLILTGYFQALALLSDLF